MAFQCTEWRIMARHLVVQLYTFTILMIISGARLRSCDLLPMHREERRHLKRSLEILILGTCAVLGLAWAATTRHFPANGFSLDYLIDLSSLLTVASFSVRGMLPLRVLAVASQLIAIPYFMFQATPLWTPAGWTGLFLAINLYHIMCILLERRPVNLTPDEQRLYDLAFKNFAPRDFVKLLQLGEWKTAKPGGSILTQGQPITQIVVPIAGTVSASQDGKVVGRLYPGELIGAGIALTDQAAGFSADFEAEASYMCWSVTDIQQFLKKNPELALNFSDLVNRYLVAQINKLGQYLGSNPRVIPV